MTNEVLAGRQGRGYGRGPAAVVVDQFALSPSTGREVARDQAGFIDLELQDGTPSVSIIGLGKRRV